MKWNQCIHCGRFIGFKEFENDEAFVTIDYSMNINGEFTSKEIAVHHNCNKDKHG